MAKQKAQIPTVQSALLPADAKEAIRSMRTLLRSRLPGRQHNHDNKPALLPNPDNGCKYFEFDVGHAHPGDTKSPRGKRRIVVEVVTKSKEVREIYFTDTHYQSGSFRRVT